MPGPPRAAVRSTQPREAGQGPDQPPAIRGHCGMLLPGWDGAQPGERRWGAARSTERLGGGDFFSRGVRWRGLPGRLHPRVPAHEPDPQ